METITIQRIDRPVSRIGLGTWAIGGSAWGGTDEAAAVRAIHRALDLGITLIDTAPAYGQGLSEEIVGRALRTSAHRARAVIATKGGLDWTDGAIVRNAEPERIRAEVEDSLRRLGVDVIDLYQLHWPDPRVPIERTARVFEALRAEGKIRAIGVSNYSPEQMNAFREAAPLHTCQPPYNLFEREAERDILPFCRQNDIVTLTYGALCRGLLSGRMRPDTTFPEGDLRRIDPKFQPPRFARYLAAVDALDALARERFDRRVVHLAVRWALDRAGVGVALWGVRRPDQLDPVARITDFRLDDDAMAEIDRIVAEHIPEPVGPEFMSPGVRGEAGSRG